MLMKKLIVILLVLLPLFMRAQTINTIAGIGSGGYSGDNIPATSAMINLPSGIACNDAGYVFFAERLNNRVRKISPSGIISTVAGTGIAGFSGDGNNATAAQLNAPTGVAVDTSNNIYIAGHDNNRVRKISAQTGVISTIAGNGAAFSSGDNGMATNASIAFAVNVYFSNAGNLFIVDGSDRIRKVGSNGIISTIAGSGVFGYGGDGGDATNAKIEACAITVDKDENLFIADWGNGRIRKVDAATGIIKTFAGTGTAAYNGDGISCLSSNIAPFDMKFDDYGDLILADANNNRIRSISPSGTINTIAGNGTGGFDGDNGMAATSEIYNPEGVGVDSCGDIYIADCFNNRIRKITYPYCGYLITVDPLISPALSIHPNPTNGQLQIDNITTPTNYNLHNIVGTTLQQGALKEGSNSISLSALPTGMYLLELIDDEGNRLVRKVVKE